MRTILVFTLAAALPLLVFGEAIAGGGFFPNIPPGFVLHTSRDVTATIVLDPNGPILSGTPVTPTGTIGTITIDRKKLGSAAAVFKVEPSSSLGELVLGCDLTLTNSRFVDVGVGQPGLPIGGPDSANANWLGTDVTSSLFGQLGVTLQDPTTLTILMIPGITAVTSQHCAPFPSSYAGLSPAPGFLVIEVSIGFWALPSTATPK